MEDVQVDADQFDLKIESQQRVALAKWMSAPEKGLAWRSIANRVWHYHFGQPLVDTPNDFGIAGRSPSHPELLDWLASTLQQNDGSLKAIHRLIVTSSTYQQTSAQRDDAARIDAGNRLLWRMNRTRLDAESYRDSILHASGMLDQRGLPYNNTGNFSSAFLPAEHNATIIKPNAAMPIANLHPPQSARHITAASEGAGLALMNKLNAEHLSRNPGDSRLDARIASFELAARMQLSAPQALDVSLETAATQSAVHCEHRRPAYWCAADRLEAARSTR